MVSKSEISALQAINHSHHQVLDKERDELRESYKRHLGQNVLYHDNQLLYVLHIERHKILLNRFPTFRLKRLLLAFPNK